METKLVKCSGLALLASLIAAPSVQAEVTAQNRNDVFNSLDNITSEPAVAGLDIWLNNNSNDPSVFIGDNVQFTMQSEDPAFYTIVYVDSKGSTSIVRPMTTANAAGTKPLSELVYPSTLTDCEVKCLDSDVQITQAEPIGQDTVYLLGSQKAISPFTLGMNATDSYRELGRNLQEIDSLVAKLNEQSTANPLTVSSYSYAVEARDTQYSTRSIRRKVNELEAAANNTDLNSLNFNNINFAYNSDILTSSGKRELDGLGSVLVSLENDQGGYPSVELVGHTDAIGSAEYNAELSTMRAKSAKQYLVSEHGLLANQILIAGAGENVPIDDNATEQGRALNRRVELKVLSSQ